jgi:NitT/TauT family transport system substrate-binding protein
MGLRTVRHENRSPGVKEAAHGRSPKTTFRRWAARLKGGPLALIILFSTGIAAAQIPLKRATLLPQWVPQAQFAGYYVALEKGFYRERGLELNILPGGPDKPPLEYLRGREVDFVTLWLSSAIEARSEGVPLVNIAQISQRSALMLVAKKASGIEKPEDMEGRRVGLWGPLFQVQPRALFERYRVRPKIVPQSYSVNLFLQGGVDVASAMWYNEYHTILNCGVNPEELTTFSFHEHGLNFPEDGLYALEDTFRKDPDMCRAFVRATLKGWKYAFAHPERALDIVMENLRKAHVPATRVHQKWMIEKMKDFILPGDGGSPSGTLQPEDYKRVSEALRSAGLIQDIPEYATFHERCAGDVEE